MTSGVVRNAEWHGGRELVSVDGGYSRWVGRVGPIGPRLRPVALPADEDAIEDQGQTDKDRYQTRDPNSAQDIGGQRRQTAVYHDRLHKDRENDRYARTCARRDDAGLDLVAAF